MPRIRNIKHKKASESCVVTVQFERAVDDDEIEIIRRNFLDGKIKTDPCKNLPLAIANQLAVELQAAYDETGIAGRFLVKTVKLNRKFDKGNYGK